MPLVAAVLGAACAAPPPAPERAARVPAEELPYLLDPLVGYVEPVTPEASAALRRGHRALAARGEVATATMEAAELAAIDPAFAPAQVLAAQAELVSGDLAAARDRLAPVVADRPAYTAGWLLAGRVHDRLGEIAEAVIAYDRAAPGSDLAIRRAEELRPRAVEILANRLRQAVATRQLGGADRWLQLLRDWETSEELLLPLKRDMAVARGDRVAELAVLERLSPMFPDDRMLVTRLGELELEVGDPGEGLKIFQTLQQQHPDDPEVARQLDRARFLWRLHLLPREIQELASSPELTRADLAGLLYWLLPEVRRAQGGAARIASDVLEHPLREEIVRVVNLGLLDVDESVHRFNPGRPARRGDALEATLRGVALGPSPPACLGPLIASPSASSDLVCRTAAACGLLAEPAACLPYGGISGAEAVRWLRQAADGLAPPDAAAPAAPAPQ